MISDLPEVMLATQPISHHQLVHLKQDNYVDTTIFT
jgi:hypothetical protein